MANTYKVKKGDKLSGIAAANSTTVAALVKLNDIDDPKHIVVGQVLTLSGSAPKKKKNTTSKPKIKQFGLQSDTETTVFATWQWDKDNTKEYQTKWYYATGDGIWFTGDSSTTTSKQATYNAPSNATKVKFKVKPISKKKKKNGKETSYWTANWSTEKVYCFKDNPPDTPSVPTVTITTSKDNKTSKLTAEVDCYDTKTTHIAFEVVKNDKTKVETGVAKVVTKHASWSCNVDPGNEYKVRARGARIVSYTGYINSTKTKANYEYGEYSEYSANVSTGPSTPAGWVSLKALSETEVQLDWKNVKNATSYEVQYTTKKRYFDSSSEVQSHTVDSVVGHAEITGLESGKEYFFRVRAINDTGNSAWTEMASCIVGKKPSAPTTWSSTTTVITGEQLNLYWVHNSEDGSSQTVAELELTVNGVTEVYTVNNDRSEEEKDKTSVYPVDTSNYDEGAEIQWRVRTKGVVNEYSDWSIQRTVNVYAQPTLALAITNQNGDSIDTVEEFPFYISGEAGPSSQKPIGYYLAITANEGYKTVDQIGNEKIVTAGEQVYAKNFDISGELSVELSAGNIDLENNVSYKVECRVSMDSGLTAESTLGFTVSWTDLEYEPNAEISIDTDDVSARIMPYCGGDDDSEAEILWSKLSEINFEYTYDTYNYTKIAYGDGKILVSIGSDLWYSEDGINWVLSVNSNNIYMDEYGNRWRLLDAAQGISYGDGKFIFIAPGTNVDTITTTSSNVTVSSGPGQEQAIITAYSTDCINWTTNIERQGNSFSTYKIAYGNGRFIAGMGNTSNLISFDGISWVKLSLKGTMYDIVYANDKFFAIGESTTYYSEDYGNNWIELGTRIVTVTYGNGKYIGICNTNITPDPSRPWVSHTYLQVYTSEDGITWTEGYMFEDFNGSIGYYSYGYSGGYIIYGMGKFVLYYHTYTYVSEDGVTWTKCTDMNEGNDIRAIEYTEGKFICIDRYGNVYKLQSDASLPDCSLSVYRREFDGTFVELMTGIQNGSNTTITDPHPALDYARYRIVAIDNNTGAVSYCDLPGEPVGEKSIIIQWNEKWSNFNTTEEDETEEPPWSGSLLKLPYNIDVSDKYDMDVSHVEYIGRRNPVSYYGTQIGETASWSVDIDKKDKDILYALRRLAIYMGDVYVREPSGSGYWASIKVSFSQTHCGLTIPVTLDITRVEGGV